MSSILHQVIVAGKTNDRVFWKPMACIRAMPTCLVKGSSKVGNSTLCVLAVLMCLTLKLKLSCSYSFAGSASTKNILSSPGNTPDILWNVSFHQKDRSVLKEIRELTRSLLGACGLFPTAVQMQFLAQGHLFLVKITCSVSFLSSVLRRNH